MTANELKLLEETFAIHNELAPSQISKLINRVKRLTAALEEIEYDRGTLAGKVNSSNYAIARKALESGDE